ncbi:MAG TPA: ABC transporter permease [Acetobacteraceae bacterium]|nr:ABC transporter permease [Acetobacteraceae bacterium]
MMGGREIAEAERTGAGRRVADASGGPDPVRTEAALAAGAAQGRARRAAKRRRTALVVLTQLVLVAGLLALWEYGVRAGYISGFLFGSPSAVWHFLVKGIADGSTFRDMYITSEETALGFLFGNAIGAAVGLALWYSPFFERVVTPFILALGSIPIIALAPLVIVWAGTGLASKVLMSTLSVVVVALLAAFDGTRSTDPLEMNLLYSMGATKWQVFRLVVVPSSLTHIFSGLKLAVGFALIGAIIGEFISSSVGLGHAIFIAGNLYNIPKVFSSLLATIVIALAFVQIVGRIERVLMPWRRIAR